jgi:hypothetical protein
MAISWYIKSVLFIWGKKYLHVLLHSYMKCELI